MKTFDQTIESLNLDVSRQAFGVHFKYPVYFTRNIFEADHALLESIIGRPEDDRCHKVIVYIDSTVAKMHPVICEKIERYFFGRNRLELVCHPCVIENTKMCKTRWDIVGDIMATVSQYHMDRQSIILAIGGGSLLDVVGFAGSIIHRGMRMIRVPTTTLAQADAGIGIKNGMDIFNAKNFAGTFAPPFAVVNDFGFLSTLSADDWIGGIAEAFKVAIIKDAAFCDFLCEHAKKLKDRDPATMEKVIRRCAEIHLEHIRTSGDPFEYRSARPLDFGHWAAHKIEVLSDFAIGHGQAVAVGIAIDSYYAMKKELMTHAQFRTIIDGLVRCGFDVWSEHASKRTAENKLEIIDGLQQFQEHLGGELTVTLPKGIGDKVDVHQVDLTIIEEAVQYLKQYCNAGVGGQ
ncbi:MAG: 3-dehydroquinate synthase [Anaerohalosphaeraceae bacterium]